MKPHLYIDQDSNPEMLRVVTSADGARVFVLISWGLDAGTLTVPRRDFLYVVRRYVETPEKDRAQFSVEKDGFKVAVVKGLPELSSPFHTFRLWPGTWHQLVHAAKAEHGWSWHPPDEEEDKFSQRMWGVYRTKADGSLAEEAPRATFRSIPDAATYVAEHGPNLVVSKAEILSDTRASDLGDPRKMKDFNHNPDGWAWNAIMMSIGKAAEGDPIFDAYQRDKELAASLVIEGVQFPFAPVMERFSENVQYMIVREVRDLLRHKFGTITYRLDEAIEGITSDLDTKVRTDLGLPPAEED